MSYEMLPLRKEDLSLYYYLKHTALINFIEQEDTAPLERLPLHEDCDEDTYVYAALTEWCEYGVDPNPTERGRGWVYLDESTVSGTDQCIPYVTVTGTDVAGNVIEGIPEQTDTVVVYSFPNATVPANENLWSAYELDTDTYMIDYIDGRIVIDSPAQAPTHVTYKWHYVSLVDEWAAVEAAAPPVVVIDIHGVDKSGYQLGAGKLVKRKVDLHVFASSPAERNDIVEALYNALYIRSAPLYDFTLGTILDYDGTWLGRKSNSNKLTSLFNSSVYSEVIGNMEFNSVSARHVSLPLVMTRDRNEVMLSDLNAYRSKVSFDLVSYTQS